MKWEYQPHPDAASQRVAGCDVVNRGAAYSDGKLFFNTLDDHTIGLDAKTGKELWKTKLGDINQGETMTMAPLVVKGKVLVGNSGGEFGVRGWITALAAGSGKIAWRAYSTGPDKDVLIGSDFRPFYKQDKGQDLGVKSWPPQAWKTGGGNVVIKPGPGGNRGFLTAWDPIAGKPAWQIKEDLPVWSGALASAGDLVFYGTMGYRPDFSRAANGSVCQGRAGLLSVLA